MTGMQRFIHDGETTGASVLDRLTVQRHVSTGQKHDVRVWNIQAPSTTGGSSGGRWCTIMSTGSTSRSFWKAKLTRSVQDLTDRFQQLSKEWKRDTGHLSMVSQIAAHPSYQGIVAMGESAIPFILRDLETEPNHWFSALLAIAGEGPEISVHERGDMRAVSAAWLKWGKSKKYIE